jgi:hypothetical protein
LQPLLSSAARLPFNTMVRNYFRWSNQIRWFVIVV